MVSPNGKRTSGTFVPTSVWHQCFRPIHPRAWWEKASGSRTFCGEPFHHARVRVQMTGDDDAVLSEKSVKWMANVYRLPEMCPQMQTAFEWTLRHGTLLNIAKSISFLHSVHHIRSLSMSFTAQATRVDWKLSIFDRNLIASLTRLGKQSAGKWN